MTDLGLLKTELSPYTYPTDVDDIQGVFMGYYFPWDGLRNASIARSHGFEWWYQGVEAHGFRYENLDNIQTGIHDFFKYIKFGFGRATDIACTHVRRGRWSRERALEHIKQWDGRYPSRYLNIYIEETLEKIGMSEKEFVDVCEQFVNRDLFDGSVKNLARKTNSSNVAA